MNWLWWILGYTVIIGGLEAFRRYGLRRWGDRQIISFPWCPGHRTWAAKQRQLEAERRRVRIAELEQQLGLPPSAP